MSVNGHQSLIFIKDELEALKSCLLEIWSVGRHGLYYGMAINFNIEYDSYNTLSVLPVMPL